MPTQTINFDNVNNATFNGSSVETVKLNNTTIWEKPTFITTGYAVDGTKPIYTHEGFVSSAYVNDSNVSTPTSAIGSWTGPSTIAGYRVDYIGKHWLGSAVVDFRVSFLGDFGTATPISKVTVGGLDIYPNYTATSFSTNGSYIWKSEHTSGSNWTSLAFDDTYSSGGTNLFDHLETLGFESTAVSTSTSNHTISLEIHT